MLPSRSMRWVELACAVTIAVGACADAAPKPSKLLPPPTKRDGSVVTRKFHSEALGVDRTVLVYLPGGYETSNQRYPVFYYLHPGQLDETSLVKQGKLDVAANEMELDAIVVMPQGDESWFIDSPSPVDYQACLDRAASAKPDDATPPARSCVRFRKYATYVTRDLITWVDRSFRTIATREGRGIAGMSMGGYGALHTAMRRPELFAACVSHSGVPSLLLTGPLPYRTGAKPELANDVETILKTHGDLASWLRELFGPELATWNAHDPLLLAAKLGALRASFYLDVGTEDELKGPIQYLRDVFIANKVDHVFTIAPGKHDFEYGIRRIPFGLKFLRDHTTAPIEAT
jgi:putative tributyrin esterase